MPPIFGVWLPEKNKLLRRVHDRLADEGGCESVRYEPSRRRREEVVAEFDPTAFLGRAYTTEMAKLRVEFKLRQTRPHYWIQWWEPDTDRWFGWHQDGTEPQYGPVHLQVELPDGSTTRRGAAYVDDEHPYRTFERWFGQIPGVLAELEW